MTYKCGLVDKISCSIMLPSSSSYCANAKLAANNITAINANFFIIISFFQLLSDTDGEIVRRSFVEIQGSAGDPDSYHYVREEYVMNDDFSGRCEVNTPFISDQASNKSAAIYGCTKKCNVYGHSAVFDAFFREPEGNLTFRAVLKNRTDRPQRVCFSVNGETIGDTVTVEPSPDTQEIRISLPVEEASRVTLEMYIPDAVLAEVKKEVLGWNDYTSFTIYEAGFYSPDP